MNNKELAAKCLIEAAGLLTNSTRIHRNYTDEDKGSYTALYDGDYHIGNYRGTAERRDLIDEYEEELREKEENKNN